MIALLECTPTPRNMLDAEAGIGAYANLLLCFVVGRWSQFGKSGYARDPMAQWLQQWGILR